VENLRRVRSLRRYQFLRQKDNALLAKGETDWVFIDIASGRPRVILEDIIANWEQGQM
jgi:acyl-CoA thioester hydrolase